MRAAVYIRVQWNLGLAFGDRVHPPGGRCSRTLLYVTMVHASQGCYCEEVYTKPDSGRQTTNNVDVHFNRCQKPH